MGAAGDLPYSVLADFYERIESTSSRLAMTDYLVALFKKTPPEVIDKVVYLTQGQLRPDYEGVELGVAEKLALRALAKASGRHLKDVEDLYKKTGDIGAVAEKLLTAPGGGLLEFFGTPVQKKELTVSQVYSALMKIAQASGEGAQETKVNTLVALLQDAKPKEARYILRTVLGRLRLGIADMTILDALAAAFAGSKAARDVIERAYTKHPDLGYIAKLLATKGLDAVASLKIEVGIPVLPMLAERLSDPAEILEKLGGKCLAEYKYDGERVQAHKSGDKVLLFSRRLENITHHYPDVVEYVKRLKVREAIVEGEIVAYNPDTGEMLPFQELMHRRRKYDVEKAMKEYPVRVYLFDVIYMDGEELIEKPLDQRRLILEKIVPEGDEDILLSTAKVVGDAKDLLHFFEQAISEGCEGVMCKSIGPGSIYQMGARGWLWIKFKRDYRMEMTDTVDLVVVGGFHGRGKRAGTYGALLMAAYDPETDTFKTVCKVGTGFTDEDLAKLPELLDPYKIPHRHPRVFSKIEADVWFVPAVVLEIIGAEITLSPLHTCALNKLEEGAGLAIRFPRFTGRYRFDKKPEQATTESELIEMYKSQKKTALQQS
ncbi:ATP-dependent DNA ligase [Thermofilum pendens]|uniref:DNA ligase 2 n=1 Tax=Thermofilum pendens (strain DSM 2475 / Hrk 5) TaxID=368408 RepID=DNLI2_THEPD|nr:ATP-dependent DNA ligase [Thermofilum pendens]A1RY72.1 RecName: Full=DNA ligase 2; AltName: Full=Polydeoxyribonucleotide synthase [ATP] 2 [Thermofilum pendens Hrk 5]ABL78152.1 DNA ligase I, ATP-dependent Dnl1 [Thermofilum pendens Hrk 5]